MIASDAGGFRTTQTWIIGATGPGLREGDAGLGYFKSHHLDSDTAVGFDGSMEESSKLSRTALRLREDDAVWLRIARIR